MSFLDEEAWFDQQEDASKQGYQRVLDTLEGMILAVPGSAPRGSISHLLSDQSREGSVTKAEVLAMIKSLRGDKS